MKLLRAFLVPLAARFMRRYPAMAAGVVIWRWWRRRSQRTIRRRIRVRPDETIVVRRVKVRG